MKRAFTILFVFIVLIYARQGYLSYMSALYPPVYSSGLLSDIAEEVVAIPLESTKDVHIDSARSIKPVGNDLFLISDDVLYRFSRNGKYICKITNPENIRVADFIVNRARQELIVLGNVNDIYYYNYEGELLKQRKLTNDQDLYRMHSVSMVGDKVWAVEEQALYDEDTSEGYVQQQVAVYDSSFTKLETRMMQKVDTGRQHLFVQGGYSELLVSPDTGEVYAYMPGYNPDNLLRDTLFIRDKQKNNQVVMNGQNAIPVYPVRMGRRYWIASSSGESALGERYTFCYDTKQSKSWQIAGGFVDNFYDTGVITNLLPADLLSHTYVYSHTTNANDTVVYIVKMKS